MDEKLLKESFANYFKSATNMIEGYLVLTDKRVLYSGKQARAKFNHGALGNIIRDKLEDVMGYSNPMEEIIFDIPLSEVSYGFKRFGLSKRLVLNDRNGNEYKLMLNKKDRNEWPEAFENARKGNG